MGKSHYNLTTGHISMRAAESYLSFASYFLFFFKDIHSVFFLLFVLQSIQSLQEVYDLGFFSLKATRGRGEGRTKKKVLDNKIKKKTEQECSRAVAYSAAAITTFPGFSKGQQLIDKKRYSANTKGGIIQISFGKNGRQRSVGCCELVFSITKILHIVLT